MVDPLIFLAIVIIVLLVVVFFISYYFNKKTPVPAGCEGINITEEFCLNCSNTECKIREKLDFEKISKEIESEE